MSWKTIFKALKRDEMRKKLGIVVALMVIYRLLAHVPVPFSDPATVRSVLDTLISSEDLLGFFNLFAGGSLANFSIVLVGLGPYITASIVLQLLVKAVPKLEEISKDGEAGRRKINQYTRYLTLPLAIIQSIGLVLLIRAQASSATGIDITSGTSLFDWVLIITALVGGAMIIMWLGELMTEQGVGNGISILIFASIISQLPNVITTILNTVKSSFEAEDTTSIFGLFNVPFDAPTIGFLAAFALVFLLVTFIVVKISEAQRVLTVSYAKRVQGNRAYGGVDTALPIKLIIAGVIPVIFAFAFVLIPSFVGQYLVTLDSPSLSSLGQTMVDLFSSITNGTGVGNNATGFAGSFGGFLFSVGFLFSLIVGFTYFYTGFVFNPKDIAENLQNQGGFIAGIRPGEQTEKYLRGVVSRLNFFGSLSLGLLSILPFIVSYIFPSIGSLTLGGTGLLIVVSVAIETLRQVESKAMMITYDEGE